MKTNWIALALASLLFLFTGQAYAGSGSGTVISVSTLPSGGPSKAGVAFIVLNNHGVSTAACDTYDTRRWVVDLGTPGGQAVYSQALAARLGGQTVWIAGTGDCAVWGDTESILILSN